MAWASSCKPSERVPGLQAGPHLGRVQDTNNPCFPRSPMSLSLSFSLPSPLSKEKLILKNLNTVLKAKEKRIPLHHHHPPPPERAGAQGTGEKGRSQVQSHQPQLLRLGACGVSKNIEEDAELQMGMVQGTLAHSRQRARASEGRGEVRPEEVALRRGAV